MSGPHAHTPRDRQAGERSKAVARAAESEHPLRVHTFLAGSGLLAVSLVGGWLIALL